jgi:hypothetical protein
LAETKAAIFETKAAMPETKTTIHELDRLQVTGCGLEIRLSSGML